MLFGMTTDEVVSLLYKTFNRTNYESEKLDIQKSVGSVLAEAACATDDLPHFDRSTMDGYAVFSESTKGAAENNPISLTLLGEVLMSEKTDFFVTQNEAVYVPTGGTIPKGANAVVMLENCDVLGNIVCIKAPVCAGENMVKSGQDAKKGDVIVQSGTTISAKEAAIFALLGITEVTVYKKLRCGVIITGDEIVEASTEIDHNSAKIRDVNSYTIRSLVEKWGGEFVTYGIIGDDEDLLFQTVQKAASSCDILIITGGSSVGKKDNTFKVLEKLHGITFLTRRISVRPGKPTIIANYNATPIVGLPGNTVSAFFIMLLIVKHIFTAKKDLTKKFQPYVEAVLSEQISSNADFDEHFAVSLNASKETIEAFPYPIRSSLIANIAQADGYVVAKAGVTTIEKGSIVKVCLFD